ncbi:hypothetical protein K2173_005058 [Erythroxylum novogranatense]|uniref:Uncharacterized protein n=1 Tax=Erythroxylum novogranatense TaxID=1862640 RepID=A0AAV8TCP2_9ROSI|nr:hypothetical protein K2173_005058 [Erythroxylum novogranatense]
MDSCACSDVFAWIMNLPPINKWNTNSMSVSIFSSSSTQTSLNLSAARNLQFRTIYFSITTGFNVPISLWAAKPVKANPNSGEFTDDETMSSLLVNFIEDVLKYCSNKCKSSIIIPKLYCVPNFKDIFNLSFLALSFLICIYEAPTNLRSSALASLKDQLTRCQLREASKSLMRAIGSNLEEQWMRSINLAVTNWIAEVKSTHQTLKTPSPLFSYSVSTPGLWKIQLYCPVIAMDIQNSSNATTDERLLFSLHYHQLEGVIQFNYKVIIQEKWIDVIVNTDNIRCDIVRLLNENLMEERGAGMDDKHFPSRISLCLTPILQTNIMSVSVSKSSENPRRDIELEKSIETSFDPPTNIGVKLSAGETTSLSLRPWKFEESVYGYSTILNWFLHDSADGREVYTSKPSKMALMNPRAWFKDRYSSAYRPFTRQGGVIFAEDEYGKNVHWKVDNKTIGKTMEWEIKGWIWLTYWPNKYKTLYTETRKLEFREIVHLTIA